MRPRTEAAVGLAALGTLVLGAALLGHEHGTSSAAPTTDASTYVAAPGGAQGLYEALQRLGIDARRYRGRPQRLNHLADSTRQILVILDPPQPMSPPERRAYLDFARSADLLLAGPRAEPLMRCLGYKVEQRAFDSVPVDGLGDTAPRVRAILVATHDRAWTDSSRVFDVARFTCSVPVGRTVTTLLTSSRGPVALRIDSAGRGHSVILVADVAVFRNRALRDTHAGVFALNLFAGHYRRVVFDEYHHGYGTSGSLAGATLTWSRHSPWGWAVWQLASVGLLVLLFGAVRFGPVIPGIVRQRRSPLEHVRALATALGAARGHDEAIAAIVRGLRRRLAPPLLRSRGDWRQWLNQLDHRAASPRQRKALESVRTLTTPGQPASSVLRAANAVEDLWQTLRP